ncbi:hypothetical protein EVAR_65367_1 [Eumeta japonica]|uniref:Uncharacterized protein n=1 Tax=Eumeta variegata TaxID=151549 RepID=A0A4C1ZVL2_EUMVA|nr:hypothetical protein EVAR_65367_1 [Eumeta japonica]
MNTETQTQNKALRSLSSQRILSSILVVVRWDILCVNGATVEQSSPTFAPVSAGFKYNLLLVLSQLNARTLAKKICSDTIAGLAVADRTVFLKRVYDVFKTSVCFKDEEEHVSSLGRTTPATVPVIWKKLVRLMEIME